MSLGTIILIVLVVLLLGGGVPWSANPNGPYPNAGHFYGGGPALGGALGVVVVVVLILALLGHV